MIDNIEVRAKVRTDDKVELFITNYAGNDIGVIDKHVKDIVIKLNEQNIWVLVNKYYNNFELTFNNTKECKYYKKYDRRLKITLGETAKNTDKILKAYKLDGIIKIDDSGNLKGLK